MKRIGIIALLLCTLILSFNIYAQDDNPVEEAAPVDEVQVSAEVNDVIVTLHCPMDAFAEEGELQLQVEEITDERLLAAGTTIEEQFITGNKELKSYRLFDITPKINDVEVQPIKPVKLSFQNLILEQEDGTVIDVTKKVQEEQDEPQLFSELAEAEQPYKDVQFYHFQDETTIEQMKIEAQGEETISEMTHFSWVMCTTHGDSGSPYIVGTNRDQQSYEAESGIGHDAYTLDYILSNYNVFCSGDYLGTHVVGPMVVGGETMLHGSIGGVTQTDTGQYVHTVPSYLEGYVFNEYDSTNMPQIITCNDELPVYVGYSNIKDPNKHPITYKPYFTTPYDAFAADNLYSPNELYVDFTKAFPTNVSPDATADEYTGAYTGSNLPKYDVSDSVEVNGDKRPWNQNDPAGYQSLTTQKFIPNGYLYGNPDGSDRGTINYYRNFDGYDINGRRVLKVNISKQYITDILNETNDGKGVNDKNIEEGSDAAKKIDRERGYARYYQIYKLDNGTFEVQPVPELNALNDNRGATVADFDEVKYSKADYAFSIDTRGTHAGQHGEEGSVAHELDTIDVTVRLRPGYNFTFESLDTGMSNEVAGAKVQGKVNNVVYDYVDDTEMSNKLTIINIDENTEQLSIPRIYKSVKSDSFGDNYMFSSIEKGPAFSVLWFAPYAREVYVGYKTYNTTKENAYTTSNGSKLVGHLVVPQADVWLGGGDFNGTVVARNVDASTLGSEGHMWPFIIGSSINGIRVKGEKHVDGSAPDPKDTFYFKYKLQQLENGAYVDKHLGVVQNSVGGGFTLTLDGNVYFEHEGQYRLVISELMSNEEYETYSANMLPEDIQDLHYNQTDFEKLCTNHKFDKTIYRGDFSIKELQEAVAPSLDIDPSSSVIKWKVNSKGSDNEKDYVEYKKDIIVFHNFKNKPLTIQKSWFDENGKAIEKTDSFPDVHYDLYRDSSTPQGNRVTVEIHSSINIMDVSEDILVDTITLGYVNSGENIKFNILCNDTVPDIYTDGSPLVVAATRNATNTKIIKGNATLKATDRSDKKDTVISVENIQSDVIIKVLYVPRELKVKPTKNDPLYSYRYEGGYTSEGEVMADYYETWDSKPVSVKVPKRVRKPKREYFSVNFNNTDGEAKQPQYDNNWNHPDFNNFELVLENETLSAINSWTKTYNDLAARDKKGNAYYYKIVEHEVPGYNSYINIPIFRLTTSTPLNPIVVSIKNMKKVKVDHVDFQLVKVNEKDEPITGSKAVFEIYKDAECKNIVKFKQTDSTKTIYDYRVNGKCTKVNTADSLLEIHGLPPGTYYLKEVESPFGYIVEDRITKLVLSDVGTVESGWIENDGTIKLHPAKANASKMPSITYRNECVGGPLLPNTGSWDLSKVTIVGLAFVTISLLIVCLQIIKSRRESEASKN